MEEDILNRITELLEDYEAEHNCLIISDINFNYEDRVISYMYDGCHFTEVTDETT